ncbi:MAG: divalent metal cation transporter, partial [Planctomycetota bacterium]
VVVSMGFSGTGMTLGEILAGFIPDFSLFTEPAEKFRVALEAVAAEHQEFWRDRILTQQRDIMITAAGTAVGINMTFLLPYSMLKRRWSKDFRGLASFDLATGLFIPFVLATSCVVIASASQFHGEYDKGLVGEAEMTEQSAKLAGGYHGGVDARIKNGLSDEEKKAWDELKEKHGKLEAKLQAGRAKADPELEAELTALASQIAAKRTAVPPAEKKIASMLVKRDAWQLAGSLDKLTGDGSGSSQLIFGIGVLGMALSTIIILMLINGFTICEMFNLPMSGMAYRVGSFLPGITGALGFLFLWGDSESRLALAIPTSVFGLCLLPLAYITFILLMNNRTVLGDNMLQGGKRMAMNIAMGVAFVAASIGAGFAIWSKTKFYFGSGWYGVGAVAVLVVLAIVIRPVPEAEPEAEETAAPEDEPGGAEEA